MLRTLSATALLTALLASPAAAQPDSADRDLRCLIAMGVFGSRAQSEADKAAAAAGFSYYAGRLQGRDPTLDVKAELVLAVRRMNGVSELQPDFQRCGDELKVFGAQTQEIGAALKSAGERRGQ